LFVSRFFFFPAHTFFNVQVFLLPHASPRHRICRILFFPILGLFSPGDSPPCFVTTFFRRVHVGWRFLFSVRHPWVCLLILMRTSPRLSRARGFFDVPFLFFPFSPDRCPYTSVPTAPVHRQVLFGYVPHVHPLPCSDRSFSPGPAFSEEVLPIRLRFFFGVLDDPPGPFLLRAVPFTVLRA